LIASRRASRRFWMAALRWAFVAAFDADDAGRRAALARRWALTVLLKPVRKRRATRIMAAVAEVSLEMQALLRLG